MWVILQKLCRIETVSRLWCCRRPWRLNINIRRNSCAFSDVHTFGPTSWCKDNLAILWNIWTWIWLFGECSWIPLFEQRFHLGIDYEANLRYAKNHLWKTAGQLVSGQTETAGISVIDFQDLTWMSKKLIAQSSLSTFHCQSLRPSPTLYSVWARWETILLNPGRAKFNGTRTTIISSIWIELMDNLSIRVEDFPRTHYNGNPQSDSTDDGRIAVWTRETSQAGSFFMSMYIVWDAKGNDEMREKFKDI